MEHYKYTEIPNPLLEALARINVSPYESRILSVVFRLTYGWHKTHDRIALSQFKEATGLEKKYCHRAISSLVAKGILKKLGKWHNLYYEIETELNKWQGYVPLVEGVVNVPRRGYFRESQVPSLGDTLSPAEGTKMSPAEGTTKESKEIYKENTPLLIPPSPDEVIVEKKDKEIDAVFDLWNSLNIIQHKQKTDRLESAIRNAVKAHSVEVVMRSILNYNTVLKNKEYRWDYKWTLLEFLTRNGGNNIDRFKDMTVLKGNFGNGNGKSGQNNKPAHGREGLTTYTRPPTFRE
jgi:phage replication O-like protein O